MAAPPTPGSTPVPTTAVVGASDGAASAQLCLALGHTLAAADRSVLLLDVDADTQPLARYTPGAIETEFSQVLLGDAALEEAVSPIETDGRRLAISPFRAPFTRLARAKAPEAAQRLAPILDDATAQYNHVIVHTPPVGSNPAVAAITETSTTALVTRADERGLDALYAMQGRVEDIGTEPATTVATGRQAHADAVDVVLPDVTPDMPSPADLSSVSTQTRAALATLADRLCGVDVSTTATR